MEVGRSGDVIEMRLEGARAIKVDPQTLDLRGRGERGAVNGKRQGVSVEVKLGVICEAVELSIHFPSLYPGPLW